MIWSSLKSLEFNPSISKVFLSTDQSTSLVCHSWKRQQPPIPRGYPNNTIDLDTSYQRTVGQMSQALFVWRNVKSLSLLLVLQKFSCKLLISGNLYLCSPVMSQCNFLYFMETLQRKCVKRIHCANETDYKKIHTFLGLLPISYKLTHCDQVLLWKIINHETECNDICITSTPYYIRSWSVSLFRIKELPIIYCNFMP